MQSVTHANFGPLVSYLVPGVTGDRRPQPVSPTLREWLAGPAGGPTLGGFLYLTVAALTRG